MPHRKVVLPSVLSIFTLADPLPAWGVTLQALIAIVISWWVGLAPLQHTLGGLMTLDYVYGTFVAVHAGTWNWNKGAWGITRKAMIFSMCLFFGDMIERHGFGPYGRAAMALFYIANESLSVFRTFKAADIPVAPPLFDVFGRLLNAQSQLPQTPGVRVSTDAPTDITITPTPPK